MHTSGISRPTKSKNATYKAANRKNNLIARREANMRRVNMSATSRGQSDGWCGVINPPAPYTTQLHRDIAAKKERNVN